MNSPEKLDLNELRSLRDHYVAIREVLEKDEVLSETEKQQLYAKIDPRLKRVRDLIVVLEKLQEPIKIEYVKPPFLETKASNLMRFVKPEEVDFSGPIDVSGT